MNDTPSATIPTPNDLAAARTLPQSGRRIRPRRVRVASLSSVRSPEAAPPSEALAEIAEARETGETAVSPVAATLPPIDTHVWLSSAAEYAALEEAEQRALLQAARLRKGLLYGFGISAVVFSCAYLRLSGRLTRTALGLPDGRHSAANTASTASDAAPTAASSSSTGAPSATATETALAHRDPAVAADLAQYVQQDLQRLHIDEAQAMEAYAKVTGPHFKGTGPVFAALNTTVVPRYARFVEQAQAVHPKTLPVQVIHTMFLHSAEAKLQAFRHMQEGEKKPDGLWQVDARAELVTSNMLASNFRAQISRMAQAQGITLP